jgi:hypothetical protein
MTGGRPGDFDLGSLQSRTAARALADQRRDEGIKISILCVGQLRPETEPKPPRRWLRGVQIERFYMDDDDYHD